jgi:uncharacterized protein YjgD (DUF1641 family)
MDQAVAISDLAALNAKLDILAKQVEYLTEQARLAERRQEERAELLHDVLPIANDAIGLVTEQLEEIQGYVDLSDLLRLLKRLLRSERYLDRTLDQLESFMDLAQTVGPLADSMVDKATDILQSAEQKGYFSLARGGAVAVDRVAASLSTEDLDRLAGNVVVMLEAFKEIDEPIASPSTLSLLRQLRDPEARRGLAVVIRALRALGAHADSTRAATGGAAAMVPAKTDTTHQ